MGVIKQVSARHQRAESVMLPIILVVASLGMLICYTVNESLDTSSDVLRRIGTPTPVRQAAIKTQQTRPKRKLKLFEDITLGEFYDSGSINIVCYVNLPDWWYEMNPDIPKSQKMLLKMTTDLDQAEREIKALELINADYAKARRLKMLPLIAGNKNMTNPFYCEKKSNCSALPFPKSFPKRKREWLLDEPRLGALIVPLQEGKGMALDHVGTFKEIRIFMKSMVAQLAHAHSVGINNMDISGNRNVFVDDDGTAILFDWNGYMALGELTFCPECNSAIAPPEQWVLNEIKGHEFRLMSLSAADVWAVGIMFARMIFRPCRWATKHYYKDANERIRETILAIGGNTVIPVHEGFDIDFIRYAGLNDTVAGQVKYKPPLVDESEEHACTRTKFKVLESCTKEEKEHALDFLKSIMKFSPFDRPDYDTLLKHPFLADAD